jgi:hypothetical protein
MKILSCTVTALLAATAIAQKPLELNIVEESLTCNLDSDCLVTDLDYIQGNGKPTSKGDVCCATFPRETWDSSKQEYVFKSSKLCYSKIILSNSSEFNYYRAAYCDGAMSGLFAMSLALAAAILAVMAF